jgi:hypothetical protein
LAIRPVEKHPGSADREREDDGHGDERTWHRVRQTHAGIMLTLQTLLFPLTQPLKAAEPQACRLD